MGEARKSFDERRVSPEGRFDHPRLYLVGEAPGAEEAEEGRPFVGPAGRALDRLLDEAGIERGEIRIVNAVPYRPIERQEGGRVRNRAPTVQEIEEHGGAVLTDIRRSKPRAVVALGTSAARLFGVTRPLKEVRGEDRDFDGRPLFVTFHPAYVRRFGGYDSEMWRQAVADLRRARKASG